MKHIASLGVLQPEGLRSAVQLKIADWFKQWGRRYCELRFDPVKCTPSVLGNPWKGTHLSISVIPRHVLRMSALACSPAFRNDWLRSYLTTAHPVPFACALQIVTTGLRDSCSMKVYSLLLVGIIRGFAIVLIECELLPALTSEVTGLAVHSKPAIIDAKKIRNISALSTWILMWLASRTARMSGLKKIKLQPFVFS